jgi:hypothetical protein
MLRIPAVTIVLALAAGAIAPAGAIYIVPDRLTFGYADEGKVDASPAACATYVNTTVEWEAAQMQQAIADVCAARKRHVEAYAAIQKAYARLRNNLFDVRIEGAAAVMHFQSMVKACIDHKRGLNPGGHNIAIDIIPNEIAADCLTVGTKLLTDETAAFAGRHEQRASP